VATGGNRPERDLLALVDELLVVLDGRVGLVFHVELHLPAGDAAGLVDPLDGQFRSVLGLETEHCRRPLGERLEAGLDRVVGHGALAAGRPAATAAAVAAEQRTAARECQSHRRTAGRLEHPSSVDTTERVCVVRCHCLPVVTVAVGPTLDVVSERSMVPVVTSRNRLETPE